MHSSLLCAGGVSARADKYVLVRAGHRRDEGPALCLDCRAADCSVNGPQPLEGQTSGLQRYGCPRLGPIVKGGGADMKRLGTMFLPKYTQYTIYYVHLR